MFKKKIIKLNFIILASFLLGLMLASQLQTYRPFPLISLRGLKDIEKQIAIEKENITSLDKLIEDEKRKIENYKPITSAEGREIFENTVIEKRAMAGYASIVGEGIVLHIGDSKRELTQGENPNNLVVHDQDILMLVNDLKIAGAEAIAINGEKIITHTEIKCSGPTITINNKTMGQPFIITAIGDKALLSSAILATDSYGYLLKLVYGLEIELEEKEELVVSGYNRSLDYKYREDWKK